MSSSNLPLVLIEKILWDLPTEELVRTSILSKEWRYYWTKFPKVAFREDLFGDESTHELSVIEEQLPVIEEQLAVIEEQQPPRKSMKKMSSRCRFFNAIYQFLLLHQGPIVDFTLSMKTMKSSDTSIDCFEIDQILLHLLRKNTLKILRLSSLCELPLSIFSFHHLTDLYLSECSINNPPTTFTGFGSLTTLCLEHVCIYKKALMHILSHNPLLKSFSLRTPGPGAIQVANEDEDIIDLFKYLTMIEHLTFCGWDIWYFGGGAVPQALATSLVHLKSLCLEGMCFLEEDALLFLVLMTRSSANLEKLKLRMLCEDTGHWMHYLEDDFSTVTEQDYSDIPLEHLTELEIENFGNRKPDLEFVKFILSKSPVLKTVRLMVDGKDEELKMLRSLVSAPHASPMVEIIGDCGGGEGHS